MNYLEFINERQQMLKNVDAINESFSTASIDKVHDLMLTIFKRKISNKVFEWSWRDTTIDGKPMKSFYFIDLEDTTKPIIWSIDYSIEDKSANAYSISFYDYESTTRFLWGVGNEYTVKLMISTLGTSVAYFIPLICHIVKNGDYGISKEAAMKLGAKVLNVGQKNENRIYEFGNLKYAIYERLDSSDIEYMFEANQAQEYRWQKKKERDDARNRMKETRSSVDKENYERIEAEYQEIVNAIRGGATTIDEIKMSLSKNVPVSVKEDPSIKSAAEKINNKDPKQAFKEMAVYVKTVIKGLQPGVILCGAPGIGKSYRIIQQLKAAGYNDGHNMEIIKGKCTPRQLYISLFNYKEKGKILVIDDADSLVGPKAPEDCINMLKAALDSTSTDEGRKVSYRVSGQLLDNDGNELPKTMYYNGGVIVITNYSVGQLDTALRGRTFIQSLSFTTEQVLDIIRDLLPELDPKRLTPKSKEKAINYLEELANNGANMEISIRTFTTCANLFAVCEDDPSMSDDDVKSMIAEQMENMSARGGKKF